MMMMTMMTRKAVFPLETNMEIEECVALVRTDVSEEHGASFIRVKKSVN
jgi:hypothetical protein